MQMARMYAVSDAARTIGVSNGTIRLWEQQGLVQPTRDAAGRRRFTERDMERLRKVAWWRRVRGLNAAAIRRVLEDEDYARLGDAPAPSPSTVDVNVSGASLRTMRRNAGLTLREVSDRSGLSVSFISAVERGVSRLSPTSAAHLLASLTGDEEVVPEATASVHTLGEGKRVDIAAGITYEWLSQYRGLLEPQLAVIQPGARSEGVYEHDGEEFILVLAGDFELNLDGSVHQMSIKDSIHFPSQIPHSWANPGPAEAQVLWVTTERGVWAARPDRETRRRGHAQSLSH